MRKKDWEQINRLAQTPVSLRKHVSRIPIRTQKEKSIPEPMMIEITTQTHVLVVQQELGTPTGVPSVSTPVPDSLTHYTDDEEKGMKTPERMYRKNDLIRRIFILITLEYRHPHRPRF